eukprot:m.210111 g.210111  ORF g.210111 m.210111 type:complete len:138 (-) comp24864_c0_seq1:110-523(-)
MPPPPYSGYLVKRGGVVKNWKRRWFSLEDGGLRLAYYKAKGDRKRAGVIDTVSVESIVSVDVCGGIWPQVAEPDLSFGIVTRKRTYYCYCESRDECIDWMRALRVACRLGDIALPVGRPLVEGVDAEEFKQRFLVKA